MYEIMTGLCYLQLHYLHMYKQPDVLTLRSFIKILYYRTQKKQLYVFRVEGINKESRRCHVYLLRLGEKLFYFILAVGHY